jgi:hypothetical protein
MITNQKELEQLLIAATKFRKAIEKCDKTKLGIIFEQFPKGSCGDTALLLAQYLQSKGFHELKYVCGWRHIGDGGEQSHAWLLYKNIIIDITADQFQEGKNSVLVTIDNTWHDKFNKQQKSLVNIESYDGGTRATIKSLFAVIAEQL